eukprot:gene2455-3323_t
MQQMQQDEGAGSGTQEVVNVHSHPDMPRFKSSEDMIEAKYLVGIHTATQKVCAIPQRHKELSLDMAEMLKVTQKVFPDVTQYDCDLFGFVEPKAEKYLTPWQGVPLQPQAIEELQSKVGKHMFGIVPQYNNLSQTRMNTEGAPKVADTNVAFTTIMEQLLGLLENDEQCTMTLIVPSTSHLVRPATYLRTEQRRWKDKTLPFIRGIGVLKGEIYITEWGLDSQSHLFKKEPEISSKTWVALFLQGPRVAVSAAHRRSIQDALYEIYAASPPPGVQQPKVIKI